MNEAVEKLCAPISLANPVGHDGATRENVAENIEHDESLPLLMDIESAIGRAASEKACDWPKIQHQSATILLKASKHIQAAIYWAVAEVETKGLRGLAEGLELLDGLHQSYWETLHPRASKSGPVERASLLGYLSTAPDEDGSNVAFINKLRRSPFIESSLHGAFSLGEALDALKAPESPACERLVSAARDCSEEVIAGVKGTVDSARESIARMEDLYHVNTADLPEKRQEAARPDFRVLIACLEGARRALSLRDKIETPPESADAKGAAGGSEPPKAREWNRAAALTVFDEVRKYFLKFEPASPVPVLAELGIHLESRPFIDVLKRTPPADIAKLRDIFGDPGAPAQPAAPLTEPPPVRTREEAVAALQAIEILFGAIDPTNPALFFAGLCRSASSKGYMDICAKIGGTSTDSVRDILIGKAEKK